MEMMRKEFSELKTVTADQLMYVKEDLILPQHYTFYDFIVTKVETKFSTHASSINIKQIICRLEVRAVRCFNLT
jgi:XAP5, circadian clock regulator